MSRIDKWFYGSCLAILLLASVAHCSRAEAANKSWCGPVTHIAEAFPNEVPGVAWIETYVKDGEPYTLFKMLTHNPVTGEWTMFIQNPGSVTACTMRNGGGYVTF